MPLRECTGPFPRARVCRPCVLVPVHTRILRQLPRQPQSCKVPWSAAHLGLPQLLLQLRVQAGRLNLNLNPGARRTWASRSCFCSSACRPGALDVISSAFRYTSLVGSCAADETAQRQARAPCAMTHANALCKECKALLSLTARQAATRMSVASSSPKASSGSHSERAYQLWNMHSPLPVSVRNSANYTGVFVREHASAIALLKQSLARSKNSCARVVSVVKNPCQEWPTVGTQPHMGRCKAVSHTLSAPARCTRSPGTTAHRACERPGPALF